MSAYEDWMKMYSPEMEKLPNDSARRFSMLLFVFDIEVTKLRNQIVEAAQISMSKENIPIPEDTSPFVRPMDIIKRTSKSNIPLNLKSNNNTPKESPDIFSQSLDSSLNKNIPILSEDDGSVSSPEKCSPKIKRKRSLFRKNAINIISNNVIQSPTSNIDDVEMDDYIAATPQDSKMKRTAQTTLKKKLFLAEPNKKSSQSMFVPTQKLSFENGTQTNCIYGIGKKTISKIEKKVDENIETTDLDGEDSQDESTMKIDDILRHVNKSIKSVDNSNLTGSTQTNGKDKSVMVPGCIHCKGLGTPCIQHRMPISLKEPDQSFSGFWNLDFTEPFNDNDN